jgi:hypothetical protein
MMSDKTGAMIHCTEDSLWTAESLETIANCTSSMDYQKIFKEVVAECNNKESCDIHIAGLQPATADSQCGENAFVYVQAPCVISQVKSA